MPRNTHHSKEELEGLHRMRADLDPMWRDYDYEPHPLRIAAFMMVERDEHRRRHVQERKAAKKVRRYSNMDQVAEDFALDSLEYAVAVRIFNATTR